MVIIIWSLSLRHFFSIKNKYKHGKPLLYNRFEKKKKKKKNEGSWFDCAHNQSSPTGVQSITWKTIKQSSDLIMNTPNNKCCNSTSQRLLSLIINILVWCEDKSGSH